jgi:SAM-dependent methyltransferase
MVDDFDAPLTALLKSRPAFAGTSEAGDLTELTDAVLQKGQVSWLEVGAGDGANLGFQLDRLVIGRAIDVVAIEPAAVKPSDRRNVKWIRARVEDYATERSFDWINVRHSAYYLDDPIGELTRLAHMLAADGTLALTHWSRDCVLRRIHRHVSAASDSIACAGIEDIAAHLGRNPGLAVSTPVFHDSHLDVDRLLSDRSLRDALLDLVRRGRPKPSGVSDDDSDVLSSLLRTISLPKVRRNGIVLVQATGA